MIIIKLAGGLGNQMFQYALGRKLSIENENPLFLDPSELKNYSMPREYRLNRFYIEANIVDEDFSFNLLTRIMGGFRNKPYSHLTNKIFRMFPNQLFQEIKENKLSYNSSYLNISKNSILYGYWQNERYFIDIRNTLLKDFLIKGDVSRKNQKYLDEITNKQAIAVHIRRGDYVNNKENLSIYSQCDESYYYSAINYITQNVQFPELFIFSDDMPWVRTNLNFSLPTTYIEGDCADQDIEELFLMTKCKYHVIANSSFSWWGAWLSNFPQQIVVAPKKWFIDDRMNAEFELPKKWHLI